jgi:orotidine-5'-phosphate decarboxylase
MQELIDKTIIALDVSTLEEAKHFVDILYPTIKMFKVGSQLFTAAGPGAVQMIGARGARVFLDLKFHDIPNTVLSATTSGTSLACMILTPFNYPKIEKEIEEATKAPVFMMTVHTKGGMEMLRAAVKGATDKAKELDIKKPFIVGVTRLTSDEETEDTKEVVLRAARLAKDAGLDGVVCGVPEAEVVRREFGKDFLIVTPGIRSKNDPVGDQKRTGTAKEAFSAGADFIVVGRPILKAADPLEAIKGLI